MFTLILLLVLFALLFRIGLKITGTILFALFWLFILFPIGAVVLLFGTILCCTVLLIPVGLMLFGVASKILFPASIV